ncbi:unnamed protein product [Echinostoma caproni]|uniref:SP-RING-type domain-containing protein n=1 Tax=Echinostoma caproni TaxID=27848 RepID=A0A183A7S4_9TREM|nr:unnamed protein product [Echinostoma caproni]
MGQQNTGCVPTLTSSPTGNVYQLSTIGSNPTGLSGGGNGNNTVGGAGGNMLSGGPTHPGFSSAPAQTTNSYSQMHMSQQQQPPPYSMATDMIPTGHHLSNAIPTQFANQQSYTQVIGPNGEKMISQQQNISVSRNSGLGYGGPRPPNPTGPISSPIPQQNPNAGPTQPYGPMMSGPNSGMSQQQTQQQQQPPPNRMPPNQMGPNRVGVQTEVVNSRSVGPRPVSGLSDPATGFQSPSVYVSYSGPPVSQTGPGLQVPPYSIGMSNPGLSVPMPTMVNNTNSSNMAPIGASYTSGPNPAIVATSGRSTGPSPGSGPIPPGMQLAPGPYPSSQTTNRLAPTGYNMTQSYPSSVPGSSPFRTQPGGLMPRAAGDTASPTPQMHKDPSGPGCMGSQPPPPCSSAGPSGTGSPNPNTNASNKGPRGVNVSNPNSGMFSPSMLPSGPCLTPSNALTPPIGTGPGGMIIGGPSQSMVNSMNGCLTLGQDGEMKLNSVQTPDGCYIQSRPMSSSGSRDPSLSTGIPMNGPVCSVGGNSDSVLSSSAFPMAPNQINVTSTGIPYPPGQQMSVIPNEFDSMGATNSPLMLMTIPASSPIPGQSGNSAMMNGPVSMNMAVGGGAPAPPPYHHHHHHHPQQQQQQQQAPPGSIINCRSTMSGGMPPSASFFGSPTAVTATMTCGTTTTSAGVMHGVQLMPTMSEALPGQVQSGQMDRHFIGMSGDGNVTPTAMGMTITTSSVSATAPVSAPGVNAPTATLTTGKAHPVGGAAKAAARPKRTRTKVSQRNEAQISLDHLTDVGRINSFELGLNCHLT